MTTTQQPAPPAPLAPLAPLVPLAPLALVIRDDGVRSRLSAALILAGATIRVAPSLDGIDDTMLVVTDCPLDAVPAGDRELQPATVWVCAVTRDAAGGIGIDHRIRVPATSTDGILRAAIAAREASLLGGAVRQFGIEGDP